MTDTYRRNFKGEPIRDGQHGKKCPSKDCDYCVNGKSKKTVRRRFRHHKSWYRTW